MWLISSYSATEVADQRDTETFSTLISFFHVCTDNDAFSSGIHVVSVWLPIKPPKKLFKSEPQKR